MLSNNRRCVFGLLYDVTRTSGYSNCGATSSRDSTSGTTSCGCPFSYVTDHYCANTNHEDEGNTNLTIFDEFFNEHLNELLDELFIDEFPSIVNSLRVFPSFTNSLSYYRSVV
jgi:hypothetical protein